jgi:hypothetical protein
MITFMEIMKNKNIKPVVGNQVSKQESSSFKLEEPLTQTSIFYMDYCLNKV